MRLAPLMVLYSRLMRSLVLSIMLLSIASLRVAHAEVLPGDPTPRPMDLLWQPMRYPIGGSVGFPQGTLFHAGEAIVFGGFQGFGRTRALGAVRWDGASLTRMGSPRLRSFQSMVEWQGQLYASRSNAPTGLQERLFRWNGVDWDSVATANGVVTGLGVYQGDLVAVGNFSVIGGVAANRAARFDGVSWQSMGAGITSSMNTIPSADVVQVGSRLYVSSSAAFPSGLWSYDGTSWSRSTGDLLNGSVQAIATDGVDLYAAGSFTMAGADSIPSIGRWDGVAWHRVGVGTAMNLGSSGIAYRAGRIVANVIDGNDVVSEFDGVNWRGLGDASRPFAGTLARLASNGVRLLVTRAYRPTSGEIADVRILDGTVWSNITDTWGPDMLGAERYLWSAQVAQDRLFVCGANGTTANATHGLPTRNIAAWDGSGWSMLGSGLGGQPFGLEESGGQLIVAGVVSIPNGGGRMGSWSGTSWTGFGPGLAASPTALQLHLGTIYAATDNGVWRFVDPGYQQVGGAGALVGGCAALTEWSSQLIAGGSFTASLSGQPLSRVARWDGTAWQPLGAGLSGDCVALASFGGDLVAGGSFATAGGIAVNGAARWDGAEWHPMGTHVRSISGLAELDGVLYACGFFEHPDGEISQTVARWDGTDWTPLGSGIENGFGAFFWVAGYHGDLFAGGEFSHAFGQVSASIIRLPAANTLAVGGHPDLPPLTLSASPNPGRGPVALSFTLARDARARLTIVDVMGREVAVLLDDALAVGPHRFDWTAPTAPGLYFARLAVAGERARTVRVVRLD